MMDVAATAESELQKVDIARTLMARARDLVPLLRARAEDAERLRRAPEETIADYIDAGLLRLSKPARYGGYELGWDALCEISQVLATGCGAQAWVQWVFNDHAHMLATFHPAAQDDVWGGRDNTFIAASFDPVGRARRVDGGFVFSGRHGFSSGIDYGTWLICGGYIVEGARLDGPHFFLIPKADVTVIDDWHTIGLEGSGSKSFAVTEKFVPAHRWLDGQLAHKGQAPGISINTSYVYRLPRGGVTSTGFASLAIGVATGVLHEWLTMTGPRKSRHVAIGELPTTHLIAGESSAEIDAARALCNESIRDVMRKLKHSEEVSGAEKSRSNATSRMRVSSSSKPVRGFSTTRADAPCSGKTPCKDSTATCWPPPRITAWFGIRPRSITVRHCSRLIGPRSPNERVIASEALVLELYHGGHTTNSRKVRLCLREKGLVYVSRFLDLHNFEQHRPEYIALNPNGVVPTLVDDGAIIIESMLINEYIDEKFPDPPLRPATPAGRARMRVWTKLADEFGPAALVARTLAGF